jgi:hypothetical protein
MLLEPGLDRSHVVGPDQPEAMLPRPSSGQPRGMLPVPIHRKCFLAKVEDSSISTPYQRILVSIASLVSLPHLIRPS